MKQIIDDIKMWWMLLDNTNRAMIVSASVIAVAILLGGCATDIAQEFALNTVTESLR